MASITRKGLNAVEAHPEREMIEKEILARKRSYAQIARTYGISVHSLNTHLVKRMKPAMLARIEVDKNDLGKSTRENLDWMIGQAKEGVVDAKLVSDFSGMASLLGAGIRAVELLSEVNGEIRKVSTKPELGANSAPQQVMIQVIAIPKGAIEEDSDDNRMTIPAPKVDILPNR